MRFTVRTILLLIAFLSLAFSFWPDSDRRPKNGYHLFVCLTILLALSVVLIDSARILRAERGKDGAAPGHRRELIAIVAAIIGLVPHAFLWLFALIEQYESTHVFFVDHIVRILAHAAVISHIPASLFLLMSFWIFPGVRNNPPLFVVRLIWQFSSIGVPLFIYHFILPGLG